MELNEDELKEIQGCVEKKLKGIGWVLDNKEPDKREALETRRNVQESILAKISNRLNEERKE